MTDPPPTFTGNTGAEDTRHLEKAVVPDTAEPSEAASYVSYLAEHPKTATRFGWHRVLEQLLAGVEIITVGPPGSQLRGQWPLAARTTTG